VKHKPHWGAAPEDWQRLIDLGLGCDLLPVVSNPGAKISPRSAIKAIGKTPSLYNSAREVTGISQWTAHQASDAELKRWMAEPDYGICVQTRSYRALDIDVEDRAVAEAIVKATYRALGWKVPRRWREGSGKCLLMFKLTGGYSKRVMHVEGGAIEFLANGQQFIAYGTHPKGERYQWEGDYSLDEVEISPAEFDAMWQELTEQFAIEPPREMKHTERKRGADLDIADPVADYLDEKGLALGEDSRGAILVECPWQDEHSSGEAGDTSTVWFRAGTNGHSTGHFKCLHAHCASRTRQDYLVAIGYEDPVADDFEDLGPDPGVIPSSQSGDSDGETVSPNRFELLTLEEYISAPRPTYIIKKLIPKAELGMVYGVSTGGKSLVMIELMMCVARGIPWRGLKVRQGKVAYIVAEGSGGFQLRLEAYLKHHNLSPRGIPFYAMRAAPNLLDPKQVKEICAAILRRGADVIVVDTLAQTTPGADENSAQDMGKAIANVRAVGRAVGATVILVHHAGKDAAKGARGWSGLRAAADFELEITRDGDNRAINTTKQKDGRDDLSWGFKLETVPIDMDEDGDIIESAVVVENDVQVAPGVGSGGRSASGRRQATIDKNLKMKKWGAAILEAYSELALGGSVLESEAILVAREKSKETNPDVPDGRRAWLVNRALDGFKKEGDGQLFYVENGFLRELEGEA
jgi:hypothetical protein